MTVADVDGEGEMAGMVEDDANRNGREWHVYRGTGQPHDGIDRLPEPPPWRAFNGGPLVDPPPPDDDFPGRRLDGVTRAQAYQADPHVLEVVNAALYLRRPLLVTGKPGTGKSTLAYSIAYELGLGPVLYWPVSSRSTLREALYVYDAIGRLQQSNLAPAGGGGSTPAADIGRFLQLGPLGSALLPQRRPRVLLIDEIDKSDIDLPNDLLAVFEEGRFVIPELARTAAEQPEVVVSTADASEHFVRVVRGRVSCRAFPVVVITSNGEREFPPAFLRRCLRLDIRPPSADQLAQIVAAQLGAEAAARSVPLIQEFMARREDGDVATDQLLNAIYLATSGTYAARSTQDLLTEILLRPLSRAGSG